MYVKVVCNTAHTYVHVHAYTHYTTLTKKWRAVNIILYLASFPYLGHSSITRFYFYIYYPTDVGIFIAIYHVTKRCVSFWNIKWPNAPFSVCAYRSVNPITTGTVSFAFRLRSVCIPFAFRLRSVCIPFALHLHFICAFNRLQYCML
jgi:hypothetical protein